MNGLLTELREGLEADGIPVVPRALSDHRANLGEGLLYLGDGWHVEVLGEGRYARLFRLVPAAKPRRLPLRASAKAVLRDARDHVLDGVVVDPRRPDR